MQNSDRVIQLIISVFLIVGVYQFYFWCQRNHVNSPRQFLYVAISYMLLLGFQMAFFMLLPVVVPTEWRACNTVRGRSERFLAFVQSFDGRSNSFPSMHTSVAMLTALHLYPALGAWAYAFPLLIGLSCLYTKQHYVIDLPAGASLGWFVFNLFKMIYRA